MNQLRTLLAILAAPASRQMVLLPGLPRDQGAADYYLNLDRNALLTIVMSFNEHFWHRDNESRVEYCERLGLAPDYDGGRASIGELEYVLAALRPHTAGIWTKQALERKVEWRLVRRLAQIVLAENGWPDDVSVEEANSLVQRRSLLLLRDWREYGRPPGL